MATLKPSDIPAQIEALGCEPSVGPRGDGYEIQQNPREFAIFWDKINRVRKIKTVLELGTGRTGGLAYFMAEYLGVKVVSVDINRPRLSHKNVEFIQATTEAAFPFLRHELFDLVFIDADHAYSAVKVDHSLYGSNGHVIAFHDIAEGRACCPGTIEYWAELKGILEADDIEAHEAIASERPAGIGWYYNENPEAGKHWTEAYGSRFKDKTAPDITLVTGTYNRLPMLKGMVKTAKASVPDGIVMDFVIVDGGSTDGTLEYLRTQKDVTLIEQRELLGGSRAFTDGAKMARGKYVVMANDDITFEPDAIFKGLCFMERFPHIGAGAFQFQPANNSGAKWRVNTQMAWIDKKLYSVPYVQVGLVDRVIGEAAGWWGGDDPDFKARHYGTDNYLTARILECGFHVDEVSGARFIDLIPNDELKKKNGAGALGQNHPDTIAFMERFGGEGEAVFNATPINYERQPALRIVYAPIYADDSPELKAHKRGWLESFQRLGLTVEVDYRNYARKHGIQALERYFVGIMEDFKPHLLITQVHGADTFTPDLLRKIRTASPDTVVINWNGDEASPIFEKDEQARAFMRMCDVVAVQNGALFPHAVEHGINLHYVFPSYEPVEPDTTQTAHDVVFLGNAGRAPYYEQFDPQAEKPRLTMERRIRQALPDLNIGFYGRGWDKGEGENIHNWGAQYGLYKNAKISIVDNQYFWAYGYLSSRLMRAMIHAQCIFLKPCDGLERLFGLIEGVHYVGWQTNDELIEKIRYYMAHDKERLAIGEAGREFVRTYHHYDARTRALLDTMNHIKRQTRRNEGVMELIYTGKSKKPFGGNVGGLKWYFDPSQSDTLEVDERIGKRLMQSEDWTLKPEKAKTASRKVSKKSDSDEDTQDDGNSSDDSQLQTA